jgi:hypothetical protein
MMRPTRRKKARALLAAFSRQLGTETLNVRVYRDRKSCVCERELVERDGTTFTMVFPFGPLEALRNLLVSDPLYGSVRSEVDGILGKLERCLRSYDTESIS